MEMLCCLQTLCAVSECPLARPAALDRWSRTSCSSEATCPSRGRTGCASWLIKAMRCCVLAPHFRFALFLFRLSTCTCIIVYSETSLLAKVKSVKTYFMLPNSHVEHPSMRDSIPSLFAGLRSSTPANSDKPRILDKTRVANSITI